MKHKDMIKKISAGLFFILCIALIVGVVFTLGMERGLTEPKFQMTVLFRKVGGLSVGSPAWLSGVTVGTVSDIGFLDKEVEGRGVKVTLSLFKKYEKQLHKSIRVAIITEGVLGEKIVEVTTDPDAWQADLHKTFIGEDPLDMQDLAETFKGAAVALRETSKTIDTIIWEMNKISGITRRLLNRIEQRVIDGTLFKVF